MSKKVISVFLALVLMIPSFASAEIAEPSSFREMFQEKTVQNANGETGVAASKALNALLYQANGKLEDSDKVEVIVSFRPGSFSDLGKEVPASALFEGDNVERQQDLGENVVAEGIRRIEDKIGAFTPIFEYHVLFFGFAAELTFADAKEIAQMDFVNFVEIATERTKPKLENPLPVMTKDANDIRLRSALRDPFDVRELVGHTDTFNKFKGEGTLIAIIDSGYDVTHRSFYLSDLGASMAKLSKDDVNGLIAEGKLKGEYVKDKIPFVYNYRESNNYVKEANAHSHGQHVAGIAAGNGVKYKSGEADAYFAGIAPEAQLALMRVFKDSSPGTSSVYYAKALDDAAILKADSANMSLGAPAGDYRFMDTHTIEALKKLKEAGCVVAIAAGNETAFGNELGLLPDANNPDYGILGTPAIEENSLAVASLQNDVVVQPYFEILSSADAKKGEIQSISWQRTLGKFEEGKVYEYAFVGLGRAEDVENVDLTGKIALIERGAINFSTKVENAVGKGAVGVIIFNSEAGGEQFVGMAGVDKAKVPVGSILRSVGLALAKDQKWIKLTKNKGTFVSKTAGHMSDFSSFGLTADGDFKPDITAPGGNIYSLANDQEFVSNSGTSMASPQVAGGIALVRKRVAEDFGHLSQAEQWQLVRNLLMSTTVIHKNLDTNAPSTPRHQGAGIMWLTGALKSKVVLLGDKGETKIIRPNATDKEELTFTVKNYSDVAKTYNYSVVAVTDEVKDGRFTLRPQKLEIDLPKGKVTVPANDERKVTITVDSSAKTAELQAKMPKGYFVDGFIMLDGADEDLSIPFVTFIGKDQGLDSVEFVEAPIYDLVKEGRRPFYYSEDITSHWKPVKNLSYTHLFVEFSSPSENLGRQTEILGAVHGFDYAKPKFEEKLVISPNGDNLADYINMLYVMLRNGETQVDVYPVDKDGKRVEAEASSIQEKRSKIKNYGSSDPQELNAEFAGTWPGELAKKPKDGNYVAVLQSWGTKGDTQKAKDVEIPFIVDTVRPSAQNGTFDENTRVLSFEPTDNVGVKYSVVSHGVGKDKKEIQFEDALKGYKIPDGVELKDVDIVIYDLGYNKITLTGETVKDIDKIGRVNVVLDWKSKPDNYKPKFEIKSQTPGDTKTYDPNSLPYGQYVLELKRPYIRDYKVHDEDKFDLANKVYRYEFEVTEDKPEATVSIQIERIYRIEMEVRAHRVKGQKIDEAYKKIYDSIESVKVVSKKDFSEINLNFKNTPSLGGYIGYSREFLYGDYDVVVKLKDGSPNYKMRVYQQIVFSGLNLDLDQGEFAFRFPVTIDDDTMLSEGKLRFLIELFESNVDKKELTTLIQKEGHVRNSEGYKNATEDQKKAYADALQAGIKVLWDRNATQEEVNKAVQAIKDAEAAFGPITPPVVVDKTELARAIKAAEKAQKTDQYKNADQALKDELDKTLEEGRKILDNKDAKEEDVAKAVKAIEDAIKKLGIVDMTKLNKAIKDAEAMKKGYRYKVAEKSLQEALDKALEEAKALVGKTGVTEQQVADAIKAIEKAIIDIQDTVPMPEIAKLEQAVKDAQTAKKGYQYKNADAALKKELDDALDAANALLAKFKKNEKVTQDEIDAAENKIKAAIQAIESSVTVPDLDPSKLEQAVKDAEAVKENKQFESKEDQLKKALEDVLKQGKETLEKIKNNDKVTQSEIDAATNAIEEAIKALEIVDTTKLEEAIKNAEELQKTEKYNQSPDTVKQAIDQAIEAGKELLQKPDLTKKEVEDAVKAIDVVLAAFDLLPDEDPIDKTGLKFLVDDAANIREKDEYKSAELADQKRYDYAIEAGQAVLDDADATQDAVDKAIEEIQGSLEALGIHDIKLPPRTEELNQLVKNEEKVKASDSYVGAQPEKKEAYDQAIAAAKELLAKVANKEDVKSDEVTEAVENILNAIIALDGVPKPPAPQPPTPQPPTPQPPTPPGGGGSGGSGGGNPSVRPDAAGSSKTETIKDDPTPLSELPLATLTIGSKEYKALEDGKVVSKMMDVAPMIHKGRTMLPARVIAELLGIEVKYDDATKTAKFIFVKEVDKKKQENIVELTLGKKMMKVNGKEQMLSGEIINVDGRVLLPMTDIQKALKELGLMIDVKWDHEKKEISLEQMK